MIPRLLKYSFSAALLVAKLMGGLTFEQAEQFTLIQSPQLSLSLMEIEGKEGERIQRGLYFNPVFSYSVENVLGTHDWRGWRRAESRYELSQALEINGKRGLKRAQMDYLISAAEYEHAYLVLETINRMKKAFLKVVRAQERVALAKEQHDMAREVLSAMQQKMLNGKISQIERNKAELSQLNRELALEKACVDLEVAREELSPFWGVSAPDFDCVDYPFFEIDCPPSLEECFEANQDHPLLLKLCFLEMAAKKEVNIGKASRIPDVVLTAGLKTVQDSRNKGMILGIAFPLPLFDRNQGTTQQAKFELLRITNRHCEQVVLLEAKLAVLHKEAMRAYNEAVRLESLLLPLAQESFTLVLEGYKAGKVGYLELLEARRTLFDAKEQYIDALHAFFEKQIDLEYPTLERSYE